MKRRWLQFAVFALLGALAPALCLVALWPRTGAPRHWSAQPDPPYDPVLFPATRTGGRVYLNGDWSFRLNPDEDPVKVKVPHDWTAMRGLERYRGRAVYSRTFRAPRAWKGRRVMLHFEGVAWTADIDLNGERAGRVRRTAASVERVAARLDAMARTLQEGLVREDGKVLYVVDDGIPIMLIEESIPLDF